MEHLSEAYFEAGNKRWELHMLVALSIACEFRAEPIDVTLYSFSTIESKILKSRFESFIDTATVLRKSVSNADSRIY